MEDRDVQNLMIEKSSESFEKFNERYLVIVNIKHNALFTYDKDVKVIWDLINEKTTLEHLFLCLLELGYDLEEEDLYDIIENMSKNGILICDTIKEDVQFIKANNTLQDYCDSCATDTMPTHLHIELTNKCNLKCIHCFHDEIHQSLSFEELDNFFESIKQSQFIHVTLSGGEVGLHPEWKKIVNSAKKNGLIPSILSSLTLMTQSDVDFMIDSNIYAAQTSLYGATPEMHDSITGVDGSFGRTLSVIKYMTEKKLNMNVSCIIMKNNVSEVFELKEMMDQLGVKISFDYRVLPSRNNTKSVERLSITNKEFKDIAAHGLLNKPTKIPCAACQFRLSINQRGDIRGCEFLNVSIGNIKKDHLIDVIQGEQFKTLVDNISKYDPEHCYSCEHEEICTRCPALVWDNKQCENIHTEAMCLYTKIACE